MDERRAEVGGEWPRAGMGTMGRETMGRAMCCGLPSSCRQDQMRWECRTRQLAPQTGQCSVDPDFAGRGSVAVVD